MPIRTLQKEGDHSVQGAACYPKHFGDTLCHWVLLIPPLAQPSVHVCHTQGLSVLDDSQPAGTVPLLWWGTPDREWGPREDRPHDGPMCCFLDARVSHA